MSDTRVMFRSLNRLWTQPEARSSTGTLVLIWRSTPVHGVWELRSDKQLFGRLLPSYGETEDGCWTFKHRLFDSDTILIRDRESDEESVSFSRTDSTLSFRNGHRFSHAGDRWHDAAGESLFQCSDEHEGNVFDRFFGRLEIFPRAKDVPELSLIVVFDWYLTVWKNERWS